MSMGDVEHATSIIKGFCGQFPGVTATIIVWFPILRSGVTRVVRLIVDR